MSSSESEQVLQALRLFTTVSGDVLKLHWPEFEATFQRVKGQVQRCSTPPLVTAVTAASSPVPSHSNSGSELQINPASGTPAQQTASSTQLPRPNPASLSPQIHPSKSPGQPHEASKKVRSHISKLIEQIGEIRNLIQDYNPSETNLEQPKEVIDVRVSHLVSAAGLQESDDEHRLAWFRHRLSQRSLALEYESWRSKSAVNNTKGRRKRTAQDVDQKKVLEIFLAENKNRFSGHPETVKYAITLGKKLLDCERELGGSHYSSILIFDLWRLHSFSVNILKDLARALQSHNGLKKLAEESPDWIDRWQHKYDESCKAINSARGLDTKAYTNASLESPGLNNLKRPFQGGPSNQRKRHCRSSTSGEAGTAFASRSCDDDEVEDEEGDKSEEDEEGDMSEEDEEEDEHQSPSHEQLRQCQPSSNQAECDRSEGASCHSGPNKSLNGSAAHSRSAIAALASLVPESQVNYQSPYLPLSQPGSDAPPVHESHNTGHTLPNPRSKPVEHTLQESLQVTQEQAAISPVGSEAGATDNSTQQTHSPANNQIGQPQEDGTDMSSVAVENTYQNTSMAGTHLANNNSLDNTAGQQLNLLEPMNYTQQELPTQNIQRIIETNPYSADVLMWPENTSQQKQAIETHPYPEDLDLYPFRTGSTLGNMSR
ncbi:MAG: hypothetical protein Q9184_007187 [Pyrenodesmia sp. 2 TL-2023]